MGLDNLRTSIWVATGSGVVFFVGSSFLNWYWSDNIFTNHWLHAPDLGVTGVVVATSSKSILDK